MFHGGRRKDADSGVTKGNRRNMLAFGGRLFFFVQLRLRQFRPRDYTQIVSNAGGPVTVLTTDYGERLDDRPVSRSATVDGVPDFVNLYDYDDQDRLVALTQTGQGAAR
jgi:hypothetical protein